MAAANSSPTTSSRPAAGRIHGVESLRAIAALSVLGFHAVFSSGLATSDSWLKPYASRLDVGVSIFFVISGFLLYRSFVRSHLDGTPAPDLARYSASRLLRIIPAYWIALSVIAIWIGLAGVFDGPKTLIYFGFLQNYSSSTVDGGMLQAWSLGVEISFYAFLPLFVWFVRRLPAVDADARWRRQCTAVGALFVVGVLWNTVVLAVAGTDDIATAPLLFCLPAYLDQFALGMGLALVAYAAASGNKRLPFGWVGPRGSAALVLIALVAFLIACVGVGLGGGFDAISPLQALVKHLLFSLIAVCLVWVAALPDGRPGIVARFLDLGLLRWMGLVSYGIFLWHIAVLSQIDLFGFGGVTSGGAGAWLAWMVVAIAPVLVLAAASWYLIEQPALRARDWLQRMIRAGLRRRSGWAQ